MDSHKALPIQHLQAAPIAGISRAQVTARIAAALVGVTRLAATLFYQKVRKIFGTKLESEMLFLGEVEVDENYLGDKCKGKHGREAASKVSVFSILERCDQVETKMISDGNVSTLVPIVKEKVTPV